MDKAAIVAALEALIDEMNGAEVERIMPKAEEPAPELEPKPDTEEMSPEDEELLRKGLEGC
jgi:hypothetical protein